MIDVSPKFNTLRYARAEGFLYGMPETLEKVAEKSVPKGDVAEVARAAGITAAKRCSEMIVFCHPIPLDWVEVRLHAEPNALVVSVQDTGIGIAPEHQHRLFEKFYRIRRRDTVHIRGTGLGLAIVKSIVDLHGGRVWVESKLDEGSTFYLALPLHPVPDAAGERPEPQ